MLTDLLQLASESLFTYKSLAANMFAASHATGAPPKNLRACLASVSTAHTLQQLTGPLGPILYLCPPEPMYNAGHCSYEHDLACAIIVG